MCVCWWRCCLTTGSALPQVMFSDSNEPGEGEHKILRFVRHQRTQVGGSEGMHFGGRDVQA